MHAEFEKWYYRTYVDAATKEVAGSKIPAFYVPPPVRFYAHTARPLPARFLDLSDLNLSLTNSYPT